MAIIRIETIADAEKLKNNLCISLLFLRPVCYHEFMNDMNDLEHLAVKIKAVMPYLNERTLRIYLASEARALGKGGIATISEISGKHRNTISAGIKELDNPEIANAVEFGTDNRIRKPGGGRKAVTEVYPDVKDVLLCLVNDHTYGNPENPLTWTKKSLRKISEELKAKDYNVNYVTVGELLEEMGFSLQLNQKMYQVGKETLDRDEQFAHINSTALEYMQTGDPVISIDCKKKENTGNFKSDGAEYYPERQSVEASDHDFPLPDKGKAVPDGVYDTSNGEGYVSVGVSNDTAEFAVQSIRTWWDEMGKERFPEAKRLYITADGGSSSNECKLWKTKLQTFADEINIPIEVSHFPPGTAKWNKIEQRMFSRICKSWTGGKPTVSLEVIIKLIASTTKGSHIEHGDDNSKCEPGLTMSGEKPNAATIVKNSFHGKWNYTIFPRHSRTVSE